MSIDPKMIDQVLNNINYPVDKNQVVQIAQDRVNPQVADVLKRVLPNKQFNSADDIKNSLGNLGNMGGTFGKQP